MPADVLDLLSINLVTNELVCVGCGKAEAVKDKAEVKLLEQALNFVGRHKGCAASNAESESLAC